eukprot:TRINITY_DN71_c0_g1_i1.p1 TRINITY_DN71_c0_g1~~TRINITY_DN71_c0_g1_i1.p1  ORF type:complete len:495 (-),score=148.64 TRINITY_DN71_c0_g1_i1:1222-2706(-)
MSSEVPIQLAQWYFMKSTGAQDGPVSSDDLRDLWDAQEVQSSTLVWGSSMPEWVPIQNVPILFRYLQDDYDDKDIDHDDGKIAGIVRGREDELVSSELLEESEVTVSHAQKHRKTSENVELLLSENEKTGVQTLKKDKDDTQGIVVGLEGEKETEENPGATAGAQTNPSGIGKPSTRRGGKKRRPKSVLLTEWTEMKVNTNVYVTNLPLDVTPDQLAEEFSMCGVIKVNEDGTPRVKIYKDSNGNPKGDGLVSYAREESVQLACQVLNGACFRGVPGQKIAVTKAVFEMKGNGPFQAKRIQYSKNKKHERLLKWSKDEDLVEKKEILPRTVVLGPMFSAEEMQTSLTLYDEIREDVEMMAKSFGAVRSVRVHSDDSKCRVSVHFVDSESAKKCCKALHGRGFDGRVIHAFLTEGKLRIEKEGPIEASKRFEKEEDSLVPEGKDKSLETTNGGEGKEAGAILLNADEENDDSERLEDFGEWLEGGGRDDSDSDDD